MNYANQLRENGYVLIRNVLGENELSAITNVIAEVVENKANRLFESGLIHDKHEDAPFNKRWALVCQQYKQKEMAWNREVFSREVYDLCTNEKLLDIVEQNVGPEVMVNGDYWVRPKLPHEELTTLPWHQDGFYYAGTDSGSDSVLILSVWIPLVDVNATNGCLQLIPGSNGWGLIPCKRAASGHMEPVEDVEQRGEVLTLDMRAGDILLFDQLTLHKSLPNLSDEIRWSIDLRYSPADQPFTWHVDPDFENIYPCIVARSRRDPRRVMKWEDWQAKFER